MIRVLVVDDCELFYQGLETILASKKDISIVGFAHGEKETIEQIKRGNPNLVLIDACLPVMEYLELTQKIKIQFPEVKIVVWSTLKDEPIILEVIATEALNPIPKNDALKNIIAEDLASAFRAVHNGSTNFSPRIIDSLAKITIENSDSSQIKVVYPEVETTKNDNSSPAQIKTKITKAKAKAIKKVKTKLEKPLFPYGDWTTIVIGVVILSRTDGMGHHLGHAGLFFLMFALIARPIAFWWNAPLKNRRAIGIFAFAATVAHAIYATGHVLDSNLGMILSLSSQHQWGIWAGIISLAAMTPAAVTSFQFFQRKLGKRWRQIHLLTVPALGLAVLHTILIGPHYMAEFRLDIIDYFRSYGILILALLVFLMRRKIFWKILRLNNKGIKDLSKIKKKLSDFLPSLNH